MPKLARWFAVVGIFCFSVCAQAQTRTLAVYPGEARTLSSTGAQSLQAELQRVLTPAALDVSIQSSQFSGQQSSEEFDFVVVGSFQGDCSVESLPLLKPVSFMNGPLADTSVSHGQVLPFFRVDCDRMIQTMAPALQRLSLPERDVVFGRALARVIAHEIYHIVAQTTDHEGAGIAKPTLSMNDLTADIFDLSPATLRRMHPSFPHAPVSMPHGALAAVIQH